MSNKSNPYSDLPDYCFWRKSISRIPRFAVNPACIESRFKILKSDRVSTAGSCFAQHIAKKLQTLGYNYYIPEFGIGLSETERMRRNYGVFSARYGNIYTANQLNQLLKQALGIRSVDDSVWQRSDGKYVDPLRPAVEPDGYDDELSVLKDRERHLSYVNDVLVNTDVFVFTLGLTEAWVSNDTGNVLPIAPGVVAGQYTETNYSFENYGVFDVIKQLTESLEILKDVNPDIKVLLTVSPVPLVATYENRHVLTSTTYSKSVLRVAAEEAINKFSWVDYFPSYEIITGNYNRGEYFASDLREVDTKGVQHVMRFFAEKYAGDGVNPVPTAYDNSGGALVGNDDIVCDEEAIDRMVNSD